MRTSSAYLVATLKAAMLLSSLLSVEAHATNSHPATVFNSSTLTVRRGQVGDTAHSLLTPFDQSFLDNNSYAGQTTSTCAAALKESVDGELGGYAILAEILQHNSRTVDAAQWLRCMCNNVAWDTSGDIKEAMQLASTAIAYDVLYNDASAGLSSGDLATCQSKLSTAAGEIFAYNYTNPANFWNDIANNHLWVNMGALGLAAEALHADNPPADNPQWLTAVDAAFTKIAAVQNMSDGSWHEGDGYQFFGLEIPTAYALGAARAGYATDHFSNNMILNLGKYFLQKQKPNDPHFMTMTSGDWNWLRPTFVAVMRYAGSHLASTSPTMAGYAQAAADRWDHIPRTDGIEADWLFRFDFALHYGLEYVNYDETVASVDPADASKGLPLANYNSDQGSYIMRSSWAVSSTPPAQGLVVTLKNGNLGGNGMAASLGTCNTSVLGAGTSWYLNFGHDHADDFGLYVYGNGGWLLPEATGYDCCGYDGYTPPGGSLDKDAFHDSYYHNTVTFDGSLVSNGLGQRMDSWIASYSTKPYPPNPSDPSTSANNEAVTCNASNSSGAEYSEFVSRSATNPFHHNTLDFAIAQADGSHLYRGVGAGAKVLRTVGFDRETNLIVLTDEIAFAGTETHTVQQHFHALSGSTSFRDTDNWLKLDNTTTGGPGKTVPASTSVLGIKVLAPAGYAPDYGTQPSSGTPAGTTNNGYTEWWSNDGNNGHFVVATNGKVGQVRFLELLWPTNTANYASKPAAISLVDGSNVVDGLCVPQAGGTCVIGGGSPLTESWIFNTSGATTVAGTFSLAGSTTSDVGVVRYDASGLPIRMMVEGSQGARLSDTGGTRLLLDLNGTKGAMEVSSDGTGHYAVSAENNGNPTSAQLQNFYASSAPASVTLNGTAVPYFYSVNIVTLGACNSSHTLCTAVTTVFASPSTGSSYLVPAGCSSVQVKMWGGGGSGAVSNSSTGGGGGGYTGGTVSTTPGETLTVLVAGAAAGPGYTFFGDPAVGGLNGGGNPVSPSAGAGGGLSALLRAGSYILVAGGGGGAPSLSPGTSTGIGAGGGLTGGSGGNGVYGAYDCCSAYPGTGGSGGSQSAGGSGGTGGTGQSYNGSSGGNGSLGTGGNGGSWFGAGGGGGYMGGGGGGGGGESPILYGGIEYAAGGAGGGGSSYVAASGVSASTVTQASGSTPANNGDPDYVAGVAIGGVSDCCMRGGSGGNGLVVISAQAQSAPIAPTAPTATPGNTQVALSWAASTGATSYTVLRGTTSGSVNTQVSVGSAVFYTDTSVVNGTTYYYAVYASNAGGNSANSSQVSATPLAPPAAPTALTATSANGQVALSWTAAAGYPASYTVLRGTTSGGPYGTSVVTQAGTSYINTGLTNGTAYYFVVYASNVAGSSANSTQVSATPTSGACGPSNCTGCCSGAVCKSGTAAATCGAAGAACTNCGSGNYCELYSPSPGGACCANGWDCF